TQRTLDFAAFPTILLFTTLLRLALNVASTRIILMEGHTGAAAGVIVTRVSTDQDVGEQMVGQLFSNPRVMLLAAAVLGLLG
ncbi:FHIPEP family type III secretion protein, partial [Salmonella enterica subsp. enterica serovar Mbandaka]|nr:FHIPEP family type III secretion protein [Salmonella enterica subsp. enterica serovar Mbandaka]